MSDDNYSFDYPAINQSEIFTIVIGSLCSLFSASVVIILILRYELLMKGRRLVHYVFMIAIADTIISLFIAIGYPAPGTTTCAVQGFVLYFFSRASWFFTDVLIFQLFFGIVFKTYFLKIKYNHMIVWTTILILQFGSYISGSAYGQDDDGTGMPVIRCAMAAGKGSTRVEYNWITYGFQYELLCSFAFIGFFTLAILFYCFQMNRWYGGNTYLAPNVRSSWSTVILYPIGMLVTYVPSTIYGHYVNSHFENHHVRFHHGYVIRDYLQASNALYGAFLALVFYTKTKLALQEWKNIIIGLFYGNINDDKIEFRDTEISISSHPSSGSDGLNKIRVSLSVVNPFMKNDETSVAENNSL